MGKFLLEMKNITKRFPGVVALDDVQFGLKPGEIHSIIGENGAGKSTLMKVLLGIYKPEGGEVWLRGELFQAKNPKHAQDNGISIIYQEFNLVPDLTVAENIFIAREPRKKIPLLIDDKTMKKRAQELIDSLGINIDPLRYVRDLGVGEMQLVEILKALVVDSDILVLDEPTSALSENEVQQLFSILRKLKAKGCGIIYISHRMEELNTITDRVTILRDGTFIDTLVWKETTIRHLINLMIGRELNELFPHLPVNPGEVVLKVEGLNQSKKLKDISLEVREGEILGLTGLMGAGRTELARTIFGADKKNSGVIWVDGIKQDLKSPADAIKNGITYLPEDRKKDGLLLELDVYDNILAGNLNLYLRNGIIDEKKCASVVNKQIKELNVKTDSPRKQVRLLSGGNQQKVLLGRWFCKDAKIIIFDEPTRGIDIGSKAEIYNIMNNLKKEGVAIIMISSEMPEILGMSDRIVVMYEGTITGELSREEATSEKIMALASNILE